MSADDWFERAKCKGIEDSSIFFPERGESAKEAKAVCATCDVRDECLEYAITHPDRQAGVWGGLREKEWIKLRRQRKTAA